MSQFKIPMENLSFKKWADFRSYIDNDSQILPVYWRGQKDPSWPLASQFERMILKMNGGWKAGASQIYPYDERHSRNGKLLWKDGYYQTMRDRYLNVFKRAASGLRGINPLSLNDDQWWALGRHYKLITPLLDWTEKPYIAVFFPLMELYSEMNEKNGGLVFEGREIAVYRLFHNNQLDSDKLRIVRPEVDELGRMQRQRGLFTWLDSEKYYELEGYFYETGKGDLLTKIMLSDQAMMDGLRDLQAHGIDYQLLLPDLSGAAKYANSNFDYLG